MVVCGQLHAQATLPAEKNSSYPLKRRMWWITEAYVDKGKISRPCWESNTNSSVVQTEAHLLYLLSYSNTQRSSVFLNKYCIN
jgi:hypothetical protein